ncbi:MAG: hypothetical protein M3Y72_08625, partial [Acidobacteriota bacterium]|nr:hypothetical protein [Acidobacteriota bacterium]
MKFEIIPDPQAVGSLSKWRRTTRTSNVFLSTRRRWNGCSEHIAAARLSDRISTAAEDFFKDSLPKADIIAMGIILHDWHLGKKMHLIRSDGRILWMASLETPFGPPIVEKQFHALALGKHALRRSDKAIELGQRTWSPLSHEDKKRKTE